MAGSGFNEAAGRTPRKPRLYRAHQPATTLASMRPRGEPRESHLADKAFFRAHDLLQ